MKRSSVPNIEIFGAPIGNDNFCANFMTQKRENAGKLLTHLEEVGAVDPQVGLLLLQHCGSFSKLVHLARSTPPSLVVHVEALKGYDDDVRQCFSECTSIDTTDKAWLQAQLSLSRGGLGLRSLSHHSSAAYIASLSASGQGITDHSIQLYNAILSTSDTISAIDITDSVHGQRVLSSKFEDHRFIELYSA